MAFSDQDLREMDDRVGLIHRRVADMAPAKGRAVTSQTRLVEDCGYDSVAILELALTLESELGLGEAIGMERSVDLVTVADLEELVARLTGPKE